ncbi:helix-turn-helix domain-containing protein [Sphingopyxis sp. XHP0097]|uniref:Helix-turn-helix domain-containing protein n=1 Tax=Sphingopyxis jiangsuensis TaxID=2871171 RepID=A0ABS7MER7_9SPHN|nr:helix-turn-helix domain-containing protein [Sphingopyxis jiangsuensis]MBY4636571.1 helix-turn-helix domain-containing protein [Sphingopyxis jiangsuensis]
MPARRINPRLIKIHRAYSVEEAARALGAHKNSVRGWIKDGLPVVDGGRPVLILGHELRAYLERKRKTAKRPCPPGTIYCFKCRDPRRPALGMVEYVASDPAPGNLTALCEACDTMLFRRARRSDIATIMPGIDVQIREAGARLLERSSPPPNCDSRKD